MSNNLTIHCRLTVFQKLVYVYCLAEMPYCSFLLYCPTVSCFKKDTEPKPSKAILAVHDPSVGVLLHSLASQMVPFPELGSRSSKLDTNKLQLFPLFNWKGGTKKMIQWLYNTWLCSFTINPVFTVNHHASAPYFVYQNVLSELNKPFSFNLDKTFRMYGPDHEPLQISVA